MTASLRGVKREGIDPVSEEMKWMNLIRDARGTANTSTKECNMTGVLVLKEEGQKKDDAKVPVHLWDSHLATSGPPSFGVMPDGWRPGLEAIRGMLLRLWRRNLTSSFFENRQGRLPKSLCASEGPTVCWTGDKFV